MNSSRFTFPLVLVLSVAIVGGALAALMANITDLKASAATTTAPTTNAGSLGGAVIYNPPKPEDASKESRDAVMLGYDILTRTAQIVPAHVGNKLACTNCHFEGGRNDFAISLVGVAATYPKFRERTNYSTHLVSRVNECFERSMNGKALDPEGREMQAVQAYLHWIARGLPIYGEFPWLGIKRIKSDYKGEVSRGKQLWADRCSPCHGGNGEGSPIAPPVWGTQAYNDGAGMHRVDNFAGFSLATMPKGTPDLKPEEAIDLATFVHAQPRPHFMPAKQKK
jgi:thiosulfate dehydrogenase